MRDAGKDRNVGRQRLPPGYDVPRVHRYASVVSPRMEATGHPSRGRRALHAGVLPVARSTATARVNHTSPLWLFVTGTPVRAHQSTAATLRTAGAPCPMRSRRPNPGPDTRSGRGGSRFGGEPSGRVHDLGRIRLSRRRRRRQVRCSSEWLCCLHGGSSPTSRARCSHRRS
jgi:hypothetical protein